MESYKKSAEQKLQHASQAEILRSHQKDDEFVKQLREKLLDVLQMFQSRKGIFRFLYSDVPYRMAYFFFTSGLNNQTLGEEYTGIVQANLDTWRVPSLSARILAVIFECIGEKTLIMLLKSLQLSVNRSHSTLTPEAYKFLNAFLSTMQNLISTLILLHKGLFYVYGKYYSLGKRITGIDYAKVYGRYQTDDISWGLRLLGIVTIVQCALKIWQNKYTEDENNKNQVLYSNNVKRTCQLCLEGMPTTATPCGHIFCWSCISDWLTAKPQCPLCREHVMPSRIVHVTNL